MALAEAHGKCLRILSDALNIDYQGLACVARVARRRHAIDGEMCKKLARLCTAFAVARHMNTAMAKAFIEHLPSMVESSLICKADSPAIWGSGSRSGQEGVAAAIGRGSSRNNGRRCGDEAVEATAASREPIAEEPEAEENAFFMQAVGCGGKGCRVGGGQVGIDELCGTVQYYSLFACDASCWGVATQATCEAISEKEVFETGRKGCSSCKLAAMEL